MKKLSILRGISLGILCAVFVVGVQAFAQTYKEKVLYSFGGASEDGLGPRGGLVRDSSGALYGTTFSGGIVSSQCLLTNQMCGTVYKVDKTGKETVLYRFVGDSNGGAPWGSLLLDAQGNLYGTTSGGGDVNCQCGVVYKLDTKGVLTVLHTFTDAPSGNYDGPAAGLIRDKAGNMYGTTYLGGTYQLGSVFKIDTSGNYTLLHSFNLWDGNWGYTEPLTLDRAGNLYGTTTYGGALNAGEVFKLDPAGNITVLYSFTGYKDGSFPSGSVALDKDGNLYGATYEGGYAFYSNGAGVLYKLSPSGKFSLLYTATAGSGSYGGGLILDDKSGKFYGTASFWGQNTRGSVYEIKPTGKVTTLYSFTGGTDGSSPWAPVIRDANGNIYGTTIDGGTNGVGVVFELSPQ